LRLQNEELNDLYSSHIIIQVIKSRQMRRTESIAPMGERRSIYRVLVGKSEGKGHLEDTDLDGRIILR